MYTASFAFFEALWSAGITHVFVNLGSDHPSILEAMVKGQRETPDRFPKIITCPNEMVALSAADGYARVTGRPQAVVVHVDVGTQGLGAAVHNASCGRAPVLIFAGLSPFTQEGEMRGSRTEFIHYIQDVPDQKQIVAQYCRYTAEIKTGKNIKQMVNRALSFAMSDPKGPVYLCGAREVMEEDITPYALDQSNWSPIAAGALNSEAAVEIAEALCKAKNPLVVTGYAGRNHAAVGELVKLAENVSGLRVLDTIGSDVNFPADHPSSLGTRYGTHVKIPTADVILVLDTDVPWIPTLCNPSKDALIFHVDVDPLKQQMPVFYIQAKSRHKADAFTALRQINTHISSSGLKSTADFSTVESEFKARTDGIALAAKPREDGLITCAYLTDAMRKAMPDDATVMVESVTNTEVVLDQLRSTRPGSIVNSGAGGLGWFGGASIGAKLGLDSAHALTPTKSKFLAAIVGDGTFLFAVPASVYWISARYKIPFLTVVLNNKGWNAPRRSGLLVHPEGFAKTASSDELNISISGPTPDFAGVARAASGGSVWAETVSTVEELEGRLKEAVEVVLKGTSAVLAVNIV